jgi:hypothetical protein
MRVRQQIPDILTPTGASLRIRLGRRVREARIGDPESGPGGDGERQLVGFEVRPDDPASELHVRFDGDEVSRETGEGRAGGGFEHVPSVLGVESGYGGAGPGCQR